MVCSSGTKDFNVTVGPSICMCMRIRALFPFIWFQITHQVLQLKCHAEIVTTLTTYDLSI